MTHTEKLVAVIRASQENHVKVYANAIPIDRRGEPVAREAVVYLLTSEIREDSFLGSALEETLFRVQFRADTYERTEEMNKAFIDKAVLQNPPFALGDAASVYDDDLNLQLREQTIYVR